MDIEIVMKKLYASEGYFFSPAAQLTTTVNGVARPGLSGTGNRKRLPSGDRSQPIGPPVGTVNMRRGALARNPLLLSISTAITWEVTLR